MLTQLTIKNFAIIDELEIIFKDGLIVLTGETGAGKSIIVDALDFLLGARGNTDLIKTGTNKAVIEGIFEAKALEESVKKWFEENSFEVSYENNITVSREITPQGSKARINGSLANVSHLLYLRQHLLNIHQQSEHLELLKPESQLNILDGFGDKPHVKLTEDYRKTFFEYKEIEKKLTNLVNNSSSIEKKIDLLKHETNEIRLAKIQDLNEEEKLFEKREILLNKKDLMENCRLIYELINSDSDVAANANLPLQMALSQVKKLLVNSSKYDKAFEPYTESIENIISEVKELSSFVNSYSNGDGTGEDLNEIEDRLDLFYNLKRKYGKSLEEIQGYFKKAQEELDEVEKNNISCEELEKTFKQKEKEVKSLADKLTLSRENITKSFVNKINEELISLGFKQAILVIEFTECELSENGKEQIQFLFTANPDEPPKPLSKVASGGELSRIMLVIKSMNYKDIRPYALTMVFDEIDIGVSGEIASSVAKKLFKISKQNQVLCITHQPIIAAIADHHFVIIKNITDGSTQISIRELIDSDKIQAIAELLTPQNKLNAGITEDAKQFAKALIINATKIKNHKDLIRQ